MNAQEDCGVVVRRTGRLTRLLLLAAVWTAAGCTPVDVATEIAIPKVTVAHPVQRDITDELERVLVIDTENIVRRHDVELGRLQDDGWRVILPVKAQAPLSPDDRIVVDGLQRARINQPVDPVESASIALDD